MSRRPIVMLLLLLLSCPLVLAIRTTGMGTFEGSSASLERIVVANGRGGWRYCPHDGVSGRLIQSGRHGERSIIGRFNRG
jgi:hypothetical protein